MVCYQTRISVIAIVIGECTVLLLLKYYIMVCDVSFCFWSYCLIVYIHLGCINTQQWTTTPFLLWLPSSLVGVLCCTTKIWFYCLCDFVWFLFNSLYFFIHLPLINTQQLTTAPFNVTHVLSSRDLQTLRLYQGSADCGEG